MAISIGTKTFVATAIAVSGLTLGMVGQAQALSVVDTTPNWDGSSNVATFGQPNTATYGQTFTVPVNGDTVLDSFSLFLNQSSAAAIQFAGYIMAWDGNKAAGPILYQSGLQATTQQGVFTPFNFATGGINLTAGQQYVAFLNASNFPNSGFGSAGQPQRTNPYAGGEFVFLNNGSNFSQITTNDWTKGFLGTDSDLAFTASFSSPTAVPTPALLPGLIGLGFGVLRKRKAQAAKQTSEV